MNLWPHLPLLRAKAIAADFNGQTLEALQSEDYWRSPESRRFAPTGGLPVANSTLQSLRTQLDDAAVAAGYPHSTDRTSFNRFDNASQRVLMDFPLPFGEAIRSEMWAWITVALVPHLVVWRWQAGGAVNHERFAGPLVRNSMGRLWYQAAQLDVPGLSSEERLRLLATMGEDQRAALFERPSLAANRLICHAVATAWASIPVGSRKELLFREAMKVLVVQGAIQRFDSLRRESLHHAVQAVFRSTAGRLYLQID